MSRTKKILIGLAAVLILAIIIVPFILGSMMRADVEKKIQETVNAPVKLGGLSISILSPGASLSDLIIGESTEAAGGHPIATIPSMSVHVSWSTVMGGDLHVTSLRMDDAQFHVGFMQGKSTLAEFLGNMPKSKRDVPLPVDSLVVYDATLTMYAPKNFVAPKSPHKPAPSVAKLGYLGVDDLVLPPHGGSVPSEQWAAIALEELKVTVPMDGAPSSPSAEGAGEALDEGLALDEAEGELLFPADVTKPMRIRGVVLSGLKVRNAMTTDGTPDTMVRLARIRELCLRAPAPDIGDPPGMQLGNGSHFVEDMKIEDSIIHVEGPDGNGKPAWYRLDGLTVDGAQLGYGKGAAAASDNPGHLTVNAPTKSSEGEGSIRVAWTNLTGTWPRYSFQKDMEVKGLALPPFSSRVASSGIGFAKGNVGTVLKGETKDGNLTWDGSVTISESTDVTGKGFIGKGAAGLAEIPRGVPLEPLKVRGTLENPDINLPTALAGAFGKALAGMAKGVFSDSVGGLMDATKGVFNTSKEGAGSITDKVKDGVGDGLDKAKDTIKKGIGGLFGD